MPESPFELHDIEEAGPNGLALKCEVLLPKLLADRDGAKTKRERKQLSSRIKATRMLLTWAKTRAGYVPPKARRSTPEG